MNEGSLDPFEPAAEMLADAWGPALARSYRLGYGDGYDAGFRAAELEMEQAWSRVAAEVRAGASGRTHAQLIAERTRHDHEPCPTGCGRCSTCTHAEAWRRRGGRPFMGVRAERLMAEAQVAS